MDLRRPMKAASRILDRGLLTFGLLAIGYTAVGIAAWDGDRFAVVVLTVSALFWSTFAILINRRWGKTIGHWGTTIKNVQEMSNLHASMSKLLEESLHELVEYDMEYAVEIAERANTVMRLHSQNFKEVE